MRKEKKENFPIFFSFFLFLPLVMVSRFFFGDFSPVFSTSGFRVSTSGFRVSTSGFRVSTSARPLTFDRMLRAEDRIPPKYF
jgi:hypothetical protein